MKKGDILKIHDAVRVHSGKFAGLIGTVTDTDENRAMVKIEGIQNGEEVNHHEWLKNAQLSRPGADNGGA